MNEDEKSRDADPAAMLALMRSQRRRTRSHLDRAYAMLLIVWAGAWAIGFGALWSAEAIGGNPWWRVPVPAAATVFGTLIAAASITAIVTGIRAGRHIRGRSRLQGVFYGWSWSIAMFGGWLFVLGLSRAGLPGPVANLAYPGIFVLLVGVLYLTGAALDRSTVQFVLGIVMVAVVIVATFAGAPAHYLIYATVGPAALLVAAFLMLRGLIPSDAAPTSGGESAAP